MPSACAASAGESRVLGPRASLGDGLERAALVRRVALHALDEVGDEVPTPLELNLDLRPRVVDAVALLDEPVVQRDEQERDDDDQRDDDENPDHGSGDSSDGRTRDEDHVLVAVVRAAIEPAVDGVDGEPASVEQAQPLRHGEPVQAERRHGAVVADRERERPRRPRPSRPARRSPARARASVHGSRRCPRDSGRRRRRRSARRARAGRARRAALGASPLRSPCAGASGTGR